MAQTCNIQASQPKYQAECHISAFVWTTFKLFEPCISFVHMWLTCQLGQPIFWVRQSYNWILSDQLLGSLKTYVKLASSLVRRPVGGISNCIHWVHPLLCSFYVFSLYLICTPPGHNIYQPMIASEAFLAYYSFNMVSADILMILVPF